MQVTTTDAYGRHAVAPWLIAAVAGGVAVLLGVAVAEHGPGISPDSTLYVEGARLLDSGQAYHHPIHPPFYSLLISLLMQAGMSATAGAMTINTLSYCGLIAVTGAWILRETRSAILAVTGSLLVGVAPPLLFVSIYVWTETLFTLLCLGAAWLLTRYLERESFASLAGAAALMLVAMFTRYAGVLFVVAYLGLLLLAGPSRLFKRLRDATFFGAVSVVPITAWVFAQTERPSTPESEFSLLETMSTLLGTLGRWAAGDFVGAGVAWVLGGALLALVVIFGLRALLRWVRRGSTSPPRAAGFVTLLSALGYAVGLGVWASFQEFDPIENRLLSPIYPLLVVGGFAVLGVDKSARRVLWARIIGLACLLWLIVPAMGVSEIVSQSRNQGLGFAGLAWQQSEIGAFLRTWKPGGLLLSNHPAAAHWLSGQKYRRTPRLRFYNGTANAVPADFDALADALNRGETMHIAWFDRWMPSSVMPLEELAERLDLELVATFSDGRIFRVKGVR